MTSGLPLNLSYNASAISSGTATGGTAPSGIGPLCTTDLVTLRPQHIAGTPIKAPSSNIGKTAGALTGYLQRTSYDYPSYTLYGNTTAYGNVSRNTIRSFSFFQTDLGLHKAFRLWSGTSSFDFRAEAFNVLNKVNYGAPDGNISDNSAFGSITTAYPARQLQFAAKVIF